MRIILTLFLMGGLTSVYAQTFLPTPRNMLAAYANGTRSTDGRPGKNYWQNRADYDLDINYDPATRLLKGVVNINYTNNSPDTLKQVWFKLYQNIYKASSPRQSSIAPDDLGNGVIIDSLWINGQLTDKSRLVINATNATLGRQLISKGQNINFRIVYHFTLNKGSHIRTGEIEPNAAFIAYFFPRVAVYDDIDGWNTIPYTGTQEMYNDFCHFKAAITVPRNFVVWATGDLQNAKDVLMPAFYQRLRQAEKNDAVTTIIDSTDLKAGSITANSPQNTWRYDADSVTDFVFALSDHYLWKSTSLVVDPKTGRRTRVDAAFNPKHHDYFEVVNDARKTVHAMSYVFPAWPFPYSHISVFDGLDQMEYPMMVNDNPVEDRHESIELTDHEIFHTFFPFYMGINETKYAWMDEGWATIGEWLISPMIDSTIVDEYGVRPYAITAGNEMDLPIIIPSTEQNRSYFTNAYPKPAMGYLYIKDYLGDKLFTKALHHYMEQWHGRHPVPNDFFYSMNAGSGKDLNWFWQKWFFDNGVPDLSIAAVRKNGDKHTVMVALTGNKPVPVDLTIHYKDGSKEKIHKSIAVWEKGKTSITISFNVTQSVSRIVLGDAHTPDSNPKDNVWEVK